MNLLGLGLIAAGQLEDALSVQEAELSGMRRVGAPGGMILTVQGNLASTYQMLGRPEDALRASEAVYSGELIIYGAEHEQPLTSANNYATSLKELGRFEEAKSLLRKTLPVSRRVLGESHHLTLGMQLNYARALCEDDCATYVTPDDLREAVTTLEEIEGIARRVFGGAHPLVGGTEDSLRKVRAALRDREQPPPSGGPEVLQTADDDPYR